MNTKLLICLCCGLTLLPGRPARGQANKTDSTLVLARQSARAVYQNSVELGSHLYNGTEYLNYDLHYITGHQFFLKDKEMPADIHYAGVWYTQVPLLYDIHLDQLVLTHPTSGLQFKLANDKVQSFTLGSAAFVRLQKDSLAAGPGKTGFYQVLVDGKVQALARRYKDLQERATREGMTGEFRDLSRFFLLRDNTLIPVRTKKDVYRALPDRRKELQQFAGSKKLRFGPSREASLAALTRFYNDLQQQ
jgi:hypothetical protein